MLFILFHFRATFLPVRNKNLCFGKKWAIMAHVDGTPMTRIGRIFSDAYESYGSHDVLAKEMGREDLGEV